MLITFNSHLPNSFLAGNNLIVETETPIKTEDLNPGSNGGQQMSGNNDQLSIMPHEDTINSPSSSVSSSNALVGFDPSKRSFTEEELRPSPIRTKECYHKKYIHLTQSIRLKM